MYQKIKAKLVGLSPYSSNKPDSLDEADGENQVDLEQRRKVARVHSNNKNEVVVPAITFVNMLTATAKRIGMKVPGNKRATYTKNFTSGIIPPLKDPLLLVDGKPIKIADIGIREGTRYEPVFCHVDGKREGGTNKRVTRFYPYFENWSLDLELDVIDPTLSEEVILQHLVAAGMYNGLGRFRPQNRGTLGRFKVQVNGKEMAQLVTLQPEEAEEEK